MVRIESFNTSFASSILKQLQSHRSLFSIPWNRGTYKMPISATTGKPFSSINLIPLLVASVENGYVDPRWATLAEARHEGWRVRSGALPTKIFTDWSALQLPDHTHNFNLQTKVVEQPCKDTNLKDSSIEPLYIFNAQDLEGIPGPRNQHTLSPNPLAEAQALIKAVKIDIFHGALNKAYYTSRQDIIYLPNRDQFDSIENYYSTVLHELSHATGHPSRLNRGMPESKFDTEEYALEELRAEIASLMLCAYTGIPHDPTRHLPFVPTWLEALSTNPEEIHAACCDADAIAEYIISRKVIMNTTRQLITDREPELISQAQPPI